MKIKLISDKLDEYNEMTKGTYCGAMQKGILLYAREILDAVDDSMDMDSIDTFEMLIIRGAKNWREYAMTYSLIHNDDIAKRCLLAEDFCKLTTEEINAQAQKWMGKQVLAIFFAKELLLTIYQLAEIGEEIRY